MKQHACTGVAPGTLAIRMLTKCFVGQMAFGMISEMDKPALVTRALKGETNCGFRVTKNGRRCQNL
jgi:hypothetical protein